VAGYRLLPEGIRLGINPLTWRGLVAAVQAACLPPPVRHASDARPARAQADGAEFGRILVAEDHRINRAVLQRQLEELGYACAAVSDGAQALVELERGDYALLITDCHMPVLNGYELTRRVRSAEEGGRHLPILALTATTGAEEVQRCVEAGMDACLHKPVTLAQLQEALGTLWPVQVHRRDIDTAPVGLVPDEGTTSDVTSLNAGRLRSFVHNLGLTSNDVAVFLDAAQADRDALASLLEHPEHEGLRAWCHRAGGALHTFGEAPLDEAMAQFRHAVDTTASRAILARGAALLAMYEQLLAVLVSLRTESS
jgi:two-component system, NarL family, sensor histidine kinase EvgS